MQTIRRLYVYLLTLIGTQALVWGSVNLLRNLLNEGLSGTVRSLAIGLSMTLVGLPVFYLHWSIAQRDAARDEVEGSSRIRFVFFYAVRAFTLVPVVYSLFALANRQLGEFLLLPPGRTLIGSGQSLLENLISIAVNALFFAYFETKLRSAWQDPAHRHDLIETRRLYRYLWVLFSLIVTIFGIQGALRFIFSVFEPQPVPYGYLLANSLALIVVASPIWAATWLNVQSSRMVPGESGSVLRLVFLYLVSLAGVVGVVAASGSVLSSLFARLLGKPLTGVELMREIAPSLATLIPMAVLWAYHWKILDRELAESADLPHREGIRRLYYAVLSALGLAVTFTGIFTLIGFITGALMTQGRLVPGWGQLNSGLASLVIGLPLWLAAWNPLQKEVRQPGEIGAAARRSLVRRAYLYLAVFLFIIGLMVAGGTLFYNLAAHWLGSPVIGIGQLVLERCLTLAWLAAFLVYHQRFLQQDVRAGQNNLQEQLSAFPVLLLGRPADMPILEAVFDDLKRSTPMLPVSRQILPASLSDFKDLKASLVVIPSGLLTDPPEGFQPWLRSFQAKRLVLPQAEPSWLWAGARARSQTELAADAAAMVRQLAEGQTQRPGFPSNPWSIVGYILGSLFALQMLIVMFSLLVTSLYD